MLRLSGRFHRIVFAADADRVLDGARSPEGRFHHDGEPALYASPTPEAAAMAVATYLGPGDPPRAIVEIEVAGAQVCDLRDGTTLADLGLRGHEASVPWRPQRNAGLPATSWLASDAVRRADGDGMIYTSRTVAARWHLVLFRWNAAGGAHVRTLGPARPWQPPADQAGGL